MLQPEKQLKSAEILFRQQKPSFQDVCKAQKQIQIFDESNKKSKIALKA